MRLEFGDDPVGDVRIVPSGRSPAAGDGSAPPGPDADAPVGGPIEVEGDWRSLDFAQLAEVKKLEAERAQLLAEVAELESKKEQQNDPGYIRAQARSRLGFVFPGERAYNVYFADDPPPPSIESVEESASEGPWYVDLWREISVKTIIEEAPPMHLPIAPARSSKACSHRRDMCAHASRSSRTTRSASAP